MEEIDEEKKQKTEILAIKEFMIEVKADVSKSEKCLENLMNWLEEKFKLVSEEIKSMESQD